jgi:two-component system, OmpR family, response regulator
MPSQPGPYRPPAAGTILLVTSTLDSVRCLGETLRGAGYQVEITLDRNVALSATSGEVQVALVVASDSHSEMDDACSALKRQRPNLPVIVLGPDVVAVKVRLFALGADDYVLDTLDRLELLARIKSLIRRHRRSST